MLKFFLLALGLSLALLQQSCSSSEPPTAQLAPIKIDSSQAQAVDHFVHLEDGDSIFRWDEQQFDYVFVKLYDQQLPGAVASPPMGPEPILVTWQLLTELHYVVKYYEEVAVEMLAPVFTPNILALDGRRVSIKGYVVPIEASGASIALSATPYASCFFCGKGSPASVMTVKLNTPQPKLLTDDHLTFTGTLRLNASDPNEFYYVLEAADL